MDYLLQRSGPCRPVDGRPQTHSRKRLPAGGHPHSQDVSTGNRKPQPLGPESPGGDQPAQEQTRQSQGQLKVPQKD